MKRIPVQIFFVAFSCILCGLFSAFIIIGTPAPVTRTGLSNIGVKQIDSCLLVYGINTANNSLVVDMYDPQLRLVHQFSEKISGFIPYTLELQYQSELRLEFVITDHYNSKKQYIFLDTELKAYYRSQVSPLVTLLIPASIKVIDNFRIDDFAWEIRTETQDAGAGKTLTLTTLYQYGIKLLPAFPFYDVNRAIVLDSSAVEYAKVFLVRDNKIYVYVNQSTENGKQFVYCISGLDGALIYKTELSVSLRNIKRGNEDWGLGKVSESDACIFSNFYWDEKINLLMVAGTWLSNTSAETGLFLVQLDEAGIIKSSFADYRYIYFSNTYGGDHSGQGGFSRNQHTYYRVKSMGYQNDRTFTVLAEAYAQVFLFRPAGKLPEEIYLQDSSHHFFAVEGYYFTNQTGNIQPKCTVCTGRAENWAANHHLDSIVGYVQGTTKMYDQPFPNNVNVLTDGLRSDGFYRAAFRDQGQNGTKVLTTESVQVSATKKMEMYFTKTHYLFKSSNRLAIIEPNPIHEQNFSELNDFYAIDAQRLYRVTQLSDGYTIKIIAW